jgi:adenine-specific DNA-methyltransferase
MSWPGGDGPEYEVIHPVTKLPCAIPEGGWRYSTPEKMQEMIDLGKVVFREDHTEPPIRKTYLIETDTSSIEEDEDTDAEDSTLDLLAGSVFTVAVGSAVLTVSKIDEYQLLNLLFSIF